MKIEIEAKELTALLDYIKEQRKPIGNADDLAKVIKEKLTLLARYKTSRYSMSFHRAGEAR